MRIGIVGAGAIARNAHLPALKLTPGLEIAGIADIDEALAQRVAKKFHIPRSYGSYRDLVRDDSIEIIDICTPPQVRLDVIRLAAENGKHIIVEKPLALSLEEAIEIYRSVKENRVRLNVVQNYRYYASVIRAKQRVSGGYLGRIVTMQASGLTPHPANQSRATWPYHHGGVLYDFAPHLVDLIVWLADSPPKSVCALGGDLTGGKAGFINYAQILVEFTNGIFAMADVSWVTAILGIRFTTNIHGTGGHILLDARNDNFVEFHGMLTPLDELQAAFAKAMKFGWRVLNGTYFKAAASCYVQIMTDFLESVRNDTAPPVPVEQAVMTIAILAAAERSIQDCKLVRIAELFKSKREYDQIVATAHREGLG